MDALSAEARSTAAAAAALRNGAEILLDSLVACGVDTNALRGRPGPVLLGAFRTLRDACSTGRFAALGTS